MAIQLVLLPVRMDATLSVSARGRVLTVNGVDVDLAQPVPQDARAWFAGDVARDGDTYTVQLVLPHGPHAPTETRFPTTVNVSDGAVSLPPYDGE